TSRFGAAAPAIVAAGRMPESGNWAERAWARARSVVIVRRIGPGVKGDDAEAVVARAEARLAVRDIAGAALALKGLGGGAALAAAPWLASAGAHLEAAQAVQALHRAALARIAPLEKPAKPNPKAAP
ncbi:MAG: mitofilin family membrane protein, partial [Alphaproteobacteria bacterium]